MSYHSKVCLCIAKYLFYLLQQVSRYHKCNFVALVLILVDGIPQIHSTEMSCVLLSRQSSQ